jgi:hypothetical protein
VKGSLHKNCVKMKKFLRIVSVVDSLILQGLLQNNNNNEYLQVHKILKWDLNSFFFSLQKNVHLCNISWNNVILHLKGCKNIGVQWIWIKKLSGEHMTMQFHNEDNLFHNTLDTILKGAIQGLSSCPRSCRLGHEPITWKFKIQIKEICWRWFLVL